MPVSPDQLEWLESKFTDFQCSQIEQTTRSFFAAFYLDIGRKWPQIPTTEDVAEAGGFEAALAEANESQNEVRIHGPT